MLGIRLKDRSGGRRPAMFVGLQTCWLLLLAFHITFSYTVPFMYPHTCGKDTSCYHTYGRKLMWQGRVGIKSNLGGKDFTQHNLCYPFISYLPPAQHPRGASAQTYVHCFTAYHATTTTKHVCNLIKESAGHISYADSTLVEEYHAP